MKTFFNQQGFTLMEVAITTAVVSTALLGLLAANTALMRSGDSTFERAVAMQHASQVVERMRDLALTNLGAVTTAFPNGSTVASSNYTTAASEQLRNEVVTVSYVDTSANPLDATVTVTWSQQGLRIVSATLRTFVARK